MSLTTFGLALVILACRDLTSPLDQPGSPNRLLNESGRVVVSPGAMHGWSFYNDQNGTACSDSAVCRLVDGPAGQPLGSGSAFLSTPAASDGKALVLKDYAGTRFDAITELRYSTFRQSVDAGRNLAIALQVNADYDLTDQSVGYQGRLVYEPYHSAPGTVLDTTWQSWDAKAGKWWGTRSSVPRGGVVVTNPCVQATPCTWAQLLAAFPNVGIHATYGAVVLKAGSSWPGFRGNVDALSIGVGGTTTTFDFESAQAVPAHPPDSISSALWDSLTAPGNVMTDPPGMRGAWVRNVMMITFKRTATQAERQAVIDLIHGEVVGGNPPFGDDGEYIVRIPYATAPGDSISGPILRAFLALRGHASLVAAYPIGMDRGIKLHYRRPIDGLGFNVWPTSRDGGTGPNWGHVAVNAPLAWGCVTGMELGISHPALAVVDIGMHDANDLRPNFGPVKEFTEASGTEQHGTEIASIIAGAGNNDSGVTGMLWRASVSLYNAERTPPPNAHVGARGVWPYNLKRAILDGARVVNVSWGLEVSGGNTQKTLVDTLDLWIRADPYVKALDATLDAATGRPKALLVVSAGNDAADTFWTGWGYLRTLPRFANSIIVVGAAKRSGTALTMVDTTNGGSSVDIMAPGENIGVITFPFLGPDTPALASGTSFAAPFVVGVAGMLLSNDPSLTPDSVKSLILLGAKAKPRPVFDQFDPSHPKPFLDAYESLRLLATNPGAPLCGNRVYANSGQLVSERRSATTETIGTIGAYTPGRGNAHINAKHGGRRIEVFASPDNFAYDYSPAGWTRTSLPSRPGPALGDGGAFNGTFNATHDGDTLVFTRVDQDRIHFFIADTISYEEQARGPGLALPTLPTRSSSDCDFEGYMHEDGRFACRSFNYERGRSSSYSPRQSAVSPIDGSLYISIGYQTNEEIGVGAGWFVCGTLHVQRSNGIIEDIDNHCRDTRNYQLTLDSLHIYRVDQATGAFTLLASRLRATPTNLAISEDGKELLFSFQQASVGDSFFNYGRRTDSPGQLTFTAGATNAACLTVAIPIQTTAQGISLGTSAELSREVGNGCPKPGSQFDLPTFAPSRIPILTAGVPPLRPKP